VGAPLRSKWLRGEEDRVDKRGCLVKERRGGERARESNDRAGP
jgi:hypothetical protein